MTWVAVLYPIALTMIVLRPTLESALIRVMMAASLLPAALALGNGFTRVERRYVTLTVIVMVAHVASAIGALADVGLDPVRHGEIMVDLGRQLFIGVAGCMLMVQLRNARVRNLVGAFFGAVALAGAGRILYAYALFGDPVGGLRHGEQFKMFAQALQIDVNPLSFESLAAAVVAFPTWSQRRLSRWVLVGTLGSAIVISGSRTTQVAVFAAVGWHFLLGALGRMARPTRWVVASLGVGVALAAVVFVTLGSFTPDARQVSRLTTGRVALWGVALSRFAQHPVFGAGAESWRHDLMQDLPGYVAQYFKILGGAYHNAYLTLLAEKGLLVFFPSMLLLAFAFRASHAIQRLAPALAPADAVHARLAPATMFLFAVRALGENAGLFGAANGAVDFTVFAVLAMTVALLGEEELAASRVVPLERAAPDTAQRAPA